MNHRCQLLVAKDKNNSFVHISSVELIGCKKYCTFIGASKNIFNLQKLTVLAN